MIGLNVIAADTNEKAEYLATSIQQQFLSLTRGRPDKLQPPVESMEHIWTPEEKAAVEQSLDPKATIVGSPETVKEKIGRASCRERGKNKEVDRTTQKEKRR